MPTAQQQPTGDLPTKSVRFHHGTDQASANDLLRHGVNQQHAAAWNGSGEFWATTDHGRAEWFARSHPSSPPGACFEFELAEDALSALVRLNPPAVIRHGQTDFEFLPACHAQLNQLMTGRQVVAII